MTKLKPCPFCGGKAELLIVPGRVASWLVKCKKGCCNQMPHVSDHDAIEEWNTRWDDKKTKPKHGHWVSVPDRSPKTTTINMHSLSTIVQSVEKRSGLTLNTTAVPDVER